VTVGRTDTALGTFHRRLSTRAGKSKAITATARKIAVLFYNTLRHGMSYADPGASYYEERYRQRVLSNLKRRAKSMGLTLHPAAEGPAQGVFLRNTHAGAGVLCRTYPSDLARRSMVVRTRRR